MKTITFIRHAKSSWEQDVTDIKRPLSARGRADAKLVSKAFESYGFSPDAIYSSPANRAFTTCGIFMDHLKLSENLLKLEEQLYDFGGNRVLQFIKDLDDHLDKVMIFGHNHAFTALANSLGDRALDNLSTSGLVMIEFQVDSWKDISQGKTKLILKPKDFK